MSEIEKLDDELKSQLDMEFERLNSMQDEVSEKTKSSLLSSSKEVIELHEELKKDFLECHEKNGSALTGGIICIVLKFMSVNFCINPHYRRNIKDFEAVYIFTDKEKDFCVSAVFKDSKMKVYMKKQADDPTFSLIFKDSHTLYKIILSGSTDMLNLMLSQDVSFRGNINYIGKFAYMATHLLLKYSFVLRFADDE